MASEQARADITAAQTSQPGAPGSTLDTASEPPAAYSSTPTFRDETFEQVPLQSTPKTRDAGVQTEDVESNVRTGGLNDHEAFERKVKDTEAGVVGTFQKALSHLDRPTTDVPSDTSRSAQGAGGGSRVFKNRWDDDDTIENQLRNTTAQVVGTFKGLSSAFGQVGQKLRAEAKKDDLSTK